MTRQVPLDIVPLYVRAGSILPMGPVMLYATEQPDAPLDLADRANGAGIASAKPARTVRCDGRAIRINLKQ